MCRTVLVETKSADAEPSPPRNVHRHRLPRNRMRPRRSSHPGESLANPVNLAVRRLMVRLFPPTHPHSPEDAPSR